MNKNEQTFTWDELANELKQYAIKVHSQFLKSRKHKHDMRTIFEIGKPKVIIGANETGAYCRIHEDSVSVMKLLLKQYLNP